jgi:LytS/YehU family sensor histidine kinase
VYYYKLEGVDNHWRKTTDRHIHYPQLNPGNYKFCVKAKNSFGKLSKNAAEIKFDINKPYYKKAWFVLSSIFVALLLIGSVFYLFFKMKIREFQRLGELEKELNKTRQHALSAQMNPHFIYNSLNSVQSYILMNDVEKSSEYLSKLGDLMRRILNNSQHSSISLHEELTALEKYVEMEQIRFSDSFDFELTIDENINIEIISVPPLIIQPYVENAIHHGLRLKEGRKILKVHVFIFEEHINIHIIDNGIGRQKAETHQRHRKHKHKSHGTNITKRRLMLFDELHRNKLAISVHDAFPTNKDNKGTRVEIKFLSLT